MRRSISLWLNNAKGLAFISSPGSHTYCRRKNFYRCFCNPSDSTFPVNNTVTKHSKVDSSAAEQLEQHRGKSGCVVYRNHPGVMLEKSTQLPVELVKGLKIVLEKYPTKTLSAQVEKLVRYLHQRQLPISSQALTEKTKEVENKILAKDGNKLEGLEEKELEVALQKHKEKVLSRLRRSVYHWKPVEYDAFTTYIYLVGRIASDYSVLFQTFTEISKRDDDFKPTSLFHYGSKVGSGIWAASKVWKTIGEHYCVEESGHMNTVAQLLLQGGLEQNRVSSISGVHFRQFIPSPKEHKFSMVICAYMLIEQPSQHERLQLVEELWEMAENYLVLVENGTTAGFSLVNEAKEFILRNLPEDPQDEMFGHVFAPCPHDKSCPKLRVKNQPCLTESVLRNLNFDTKKLSEKTRTNARYSYVILKKGPRVKDAEWPRVLHPIKSQGHVHVHMCLPCGELQHVVITKGKFEKHLYGCARNLEQGDRLPVSLSHQPLTKSAEPAEEEAPVCDDSSTDVDEDESNMSRT